MHASLSFYAINAQCVIFWGYCTYYFYSVVREPQREYVEVSAVVDQEVRVVVDLPVEVTVVHTEGKEALLVLVLELAEVLQDHKYSDGVLTSKKLDGKRALTHQIKNKSNTNGHLGFICVHLCFVCCLLKVAKYLVQSPNEKQLAVHILVKEFRGGM